MAGSASQQPRPPKRPAAETSAASAASQSAPAKKPAVASSSAGPPSSSLAFPSPGTLESSLDELTFEDEFEDEFDEEDERLAERVRRREIRKRMRAELKRSNVLAEKKGEGEEGKGDDALLDHEGKDDEEDEQEEEEEDYDESSEEDAEAAAQRRPGALLDGASTSSGDQQHKAAPPKRVWRPSDGLSAEEQLDYDSSAYLMLHRLSVEWPCLSFDVIPDSLGVSRSRFPHTVYLVAGTQADARSSQTKNQLQLIKVKDMHKTKHDDSDEDEEDDEDDQGAAEGLRMLEEQVDGSSEEDDALDDDPIPEVRSVAHVGAVNRVKVNPLAPHLVASQADTGKVHIFDLSFQLAALDAPPPSLQPPSKCTRPVFTFEGQKDEGYALAWSPLVSGRLVSGDCAHGLYVWEQKEGDGGWSVDRGGFKGHTSSVEDVCWSPGEATVFCSVSADRTARMWDVRMKDKCAAWIAAHRADVNVAAWNALRQHLLATGSDDGSFKVWDLRQFKSHLPAATFTYHREPLTSIEWHPTEDSILAVSSADHSLTVWDLSLETDSDELLRYSRGAQLDEDVPPQLFFVHAGQQHIKELHWHKQIPGMCISTAQDGINIFKPENL